MERGYLNPSYFETVYGDKVAELHPDYAIVKGAGRLGQTGTVRVEVWGNSTYEATVEHGDDGWAYITLKRRDRRIVRDWRHLQAIKNEVCGPEREAFELFPAESRLVDEANQYHLWVLPEGESVGRGDHARQVTDHSNTAARVAGRSKARQRPFQPGLPVGQPQEGDST